MCPYCDFAVRTGRPALRESWAELLLRETDLRRSRGGGLETACFDTVYFGGGTPSLVPSADLQRILERLAGCFELAADTVVHLEANPEDVDERRVDEWRTLGVGFLSLGVQSLRDDELRSLFRRHTRDKARRAIDLALRGGFGTVSADLIFGLPGQEPEHLRESLAGLTGAGLPHVSAYQLTVHADTAFGRRGARGLFAEASEDEQADRFLQVHRELRDAGLEAYEVSNFARAPEHRSRHNRKYWRHAPYLGLGPSACSFDGRTRWWNERSFAQWRACLDAGRLPVAGSEELTDDALALEAVMLGLRTPEGLDIESFRSRFGVDLAALRRDRIEQEVSQGRLVQDGGWLRPTVAGLAVADALAVALAP